MRADATPQAKTNPVDPGLLRLGTPNSHILATGNFDHSHDNKPRSCFLLGRLRMMTLNHWLPITQENVLERCSPRSEWATI